MSPPCSKVRIKRAPPLWYEIVVYLYDGLTGKLVFQCNVQRLMLWSMYMDKPGLEIATRSKLNCMPSRCDYSVSPEGTPFIKGNTDFYQIGGPSSEAKPGARFVVIYAFPTKRREDGVLKDLETQHVDVAAMPKRTLRSGTVRK